MVPEQTQLTTPLVSAVPASVTVLPEILGSLAEAVAVIVATVALV
jgi:hypothetical protein